MKASDLIEAAMTLAVSKQPEMHKKWIEVMYRFGGAFGGSRIVTMASDTRTDLLLRSLEEEMAERLRTGPGEASFRFDFLVSLSEAWLLRSYELLRSADQANKASDSPCARLSELKERFNLVRVPIAKHEIAGAHRAKSLDLVLERQPAKPDDKPVKYKNDGSYIIPRGSCPDTGSVQWCAIDIQAQTQSWIRRIDLSDALLTFFD